MTAIVHVGLPKCASTSLQALFAGATGTTFLGKVAGPEGRSTHHGFANAGVRNLVRTVLPADSPIGEGKLASLRAAVEVASGGPGQNFLISDEVLSGVGLTWFGKPQRTLDGTLRELRRLFGDDTLVIAVVRNQMDFLSSYWRHLIRARGYPFTFGHFLSEQADEPKRQTTGRSVTASLFYDHVRGLAEAAGTRVAFVPFEDVVTGGTIIRDVLAAEGVTIPEGLPHRRPSKPTDVYLKHLRRNRRMPRKVGAAATPADLAADKPAFRRLMNTRQLLDAPGEIERLTLAFRRENRAFAAATGLDLERYGYPV